MHEKRSSVPSIKERVLAANQDITSEFIDKLAAWDGSTGLDYPYEPLKFSIREDDVQVVLDQADSRDVLDMLYADLEAVNPVSLPYEVDGIKGSNVVLSVPAQTEHELPFYVIEDHNTVNDTDVLRGVRLSAVPPQGYGQTGHTETSQQAS